MSVCNYESFWIITWYFSMHNWFAKSSKYIFKQHLRRFRYIGCELCTHRCVYVGTINTSFTEEQVSRNLRIVTVSELSFYQYIWWIEYTVKRLQKFVQGKIGKFMSKLCSAINRQNVALKMFEVNASWKQIGKQEHFIEKKTLKYDKDIFIKFKYHR